MEFEEFKTAYEELGPEEKRLVSGMVLALHRQGHPLPEWITPREAAKILNLSVPTVRAKAAEGVLRSKKISDRKTFVLAADVDALRKAQLGL